MLLATHSKCQLETADTVLLIEKFQGKHTSYYVKKLKTLAAQDILYVLSVFPYCKFKFFSLKLQANLLHVF